MAWQRCDPRPEGEWDADDRPGLPPDETRERQADFETPTHEVEEASTTLRPDAVTVDHQTAFTLGPVGLADPSEGLLVRVWCARVEGGTVMVCSAWMNNGGWNEPVPLFHVDDGLGPLTEIDFAFEQTGNPVVCAERPTGPDGSPEVWIYFYDATIPGPVFRNFGAGRTPRALLDRPLEIADSDVCVFYVDDEAGRIVYRQQRERYETVHPTPATADEDTFIEDVAKMDDRRVIVLYSRRDREAGRYTLHQLTSTLMPIVTEDESLTATHALTSVELDQIIVDAPPAAVESLTASHALLSVVLREPVIEYESAVIESLTATHALLGVDLHSAIIEYESAVAEALTASHTLLGVDVVLMITIDRVAEVEALTASHSLLDVTLEAA